MMLGSLVWMTTVALAALVTSIVSTDGYSYTGSNDFGNNDNNNGHNVASPPKDGGHCGCYQGPAGTPGMPGVHGMHGARGQDGRKGDKGDRGPIGIDGPKGEIGEKGPVGPPGHRGKKGITGDPGLKGDKGDQGDRGDRGYPGLPGPKGSRGEPARAPRRVAFSVVRSMKLGPVMQDTPVVFDRVFTNLGDGFDEYSSHFVCRTNGTYVFTTHILGQNNKDVYAWIMLNNKHKVPLHGDGRAGYGTGSQSIILHLRYDDHVWLQLTKESGLLNDYSTFSGFLLFED